MKKKKNLSKQLNKANRSLLSLNLLHATLEREFDDYQFGINEISFLEKQISSSAFQTKLYEPYAYYKFMSKLPVEHKEDNK